MIITKPTLKSNNITYASLCFGLVLQFYILIEQDTLSRSDVQREQEFRAKSKAFVCKTVWLAAGVGIQCQEKNQAVYIQSTKKVEWKS